MKKGPRAIVEKKKKKTDWKYKTIQKSLIKLQNKKNKQVKGGAKARKIIWMNINFFKEDLRACLQNSLPSLIDVLACFKNLKYTQQCLKLQ